MAPQLYQLVMRTGPHPGKIFELRQAELSIGRDVSNDIVVNDAEVSRKHARLILRPEGGYLIEDTGSTNGTFIGGQRLVTPQPLHPGDTILLGENVTMAYEGAQVDFDATMVSAPAGAMDVLPEAPPPPPIESYSPPAAVSPARPTPSPVTQHPVYSGPAIPGPAEIYSAPDQPRRANRSLVYTSLGCLLFLLCVVLIGAWAFDSLNLYCTTPFDSLLSWLYTCP